MGSDYLTAYIVLLRYRFVKPIPIKDIEEFSPTLQMVTVLGSASIDDRVFFWRTRKVSGWERDVWQFMYRTRLEGLHWDVLEQDRIVLEGMANDARDKEFLYQHDTGLARVRRMMSKEAEAQLTVLAEARAEVTAAEALS